MSTRREDLTQTLRAAATGDPSAAERLLPLVYEELRRLAAARMAKLPPGQTLQATALVHEAYLRLAGERESPWGGRTHFFCAAAAAMRNILIDAARRKGSLKRGGDRNRVELEGSGFIIEAPDGDILGVDEALKKLEELDPEGARIVLLRYFTGLTAEETAQVLDVSLSTIERKWRFLRSWLRHELEDYDPGKTD